MRDQLVGISSGSQVSLISLVYVLSSCSCLLWVAPVLGCQCGVGCACHACRVSCWGSSCSARDCIWCDHIHVYS
ncbi:hypothetical protein BC826DRAFT_1035708, partial [Russula brevipes]